MRKYPWVRTALLTAAIAAVGAGCGTGEESAGGSATTSYSATAAEKEGQSGAAAAQTPASSPSPSPISGAETLMVQNPVPDYDGSGREFPAGDLYLRTELQRDPATSLALFVPETFQAFDSGEGRKWGTADERSLIGFIRPGTGEEGEGAYGEPDPEMAAYREYIGSRSDDGVQTDYFRVDSTDGMFIAYIQTVAATRQEMRPLLLSMLGETQRLHVDHVPEPGIFVSPPVAATPDEEQIVSVVMAILQAWHEKDMEAFEQTMYRHKNGETGAEYFSFLMEPDIEYRFNKLSFAGSANTNGASMELGLQVIRPNGYVSDTLYLISLLRDDKGRWGVANID